MKILLLHPFIRESLTVMPPLGLGYLADGLRNAGHEVRILDCTKEKILPEKVGPKVAPWKPELVGMTVFSKGLIDVINVLKSVKASCPDAYTILGGPHVSGMPVPTLEWVSDADFGMEGEGEIGIVQLVDQLSSATPDFSKVAGLVYRDNGQVEVNPPEWVMDLDSLGMPSWDLLKPNTYPDSPTLAFAKRLPTAPILMSRGCLFRCAFCAARKIYGKSFRVRSAEKIIEEMRFLHKDYGINEIQVLDDNFLQRPDNAKAICEQIIQSNFKITWCLPNGARCDRVDKELAQLLVRAGCYKLSIGIESGSQRVLDLMNKAITVEKIKEEVETVTSAGLEVTGHFIIGFPGERYEDAQKSIRLAKTMPLSYAGFSCFIPLPGTVIGDELYKKGEITMEDFQTTSFYSPKRSYTPHMTPKQISRLKKIAYLSFYSKPRVFLNMLRSIKSPNQLGNILKRIYFILKEGLFGPLD